MRTEKTLIRLGVLFVLLCRGSFDCCCSVFFILQGTYLEDRNMSPNFLGPYSHQIQMYPIPDDLENYSFLKYWPKMHFGHKSRAITLLFLNEIIPFAIPYHSSPIPMSMQSLKKFGKKVLKLEHGVRAWKRTTKHFWHTSRAVTLLFQNEICPLAIPYHSSLIPMPMQSLKKIGQKVLKSKHGNRALMDGRMDGWMDDGLTDGHSKFGGYNMIIYIYQCICKILLNFVYSFLRYWPKMHFGHESRAITLLFLNEIIPLAIPYHSSPIPMSMQSLKKIGKKVLKLEHGN